MKITVRLTGPLAGKFGFSSEDLDLPDGILAGEVLERLGIGPVPARIVTRAGQALGPGEPLRDGDRLVISPIYSGG